MNFLKIAFFLLLVIGLAACGSDPSGGGGDNDTGTVAVKMGTGESPGSGSLSALTAQGAADEVLTRTYRISLGDSSDCTLATFVDIFDETADTSDCEAPPSDTSLFLDITQSPTAETNDSFPAGTYSCVRVTMCDQMVWSSSELQECPGTQVQDVIDPRGQASTTTFYFSTEGSLDEQDEGQSGTQDNPFPLTDSLIVTVGGITTLVFEVTNNPQGGGMIASYDSDNQPEYQCEVSPPQMTITEE